MQCPIDQTLLVMTDRQGVEIDYCPKCRGIWLDRDELNKLIERSGQQSDSRTSEYSEPPRHYEEKQQYHKDYDDDHDHHHGSHHKKKRESFLGDIFDF